MALEFGAQVARVEGGVDDAGLRGGLGELARQEDVADFGLGVVALGALVRGAPRVVERDAVRPRRGDVHDDGPGPRDAHAGRRRRRRRLAQQRQKLLVQQVRPQTVRAYLQIVPVRIGATLGRKHNLRRVC